MSNKPKTVVELPKGIYLRGSTYWICYQRPNGKTERESSKSDKLSDAVGLLEERRYEVKKGLLPDRGKKLPRYTFNDLALEYSTWMNKQKSNQQKTSVLSQLIEKFGNYPIDLFNTMLVEQFQTERLNKGNKPATTNRLIATLKHMFTKAVDWEMVEESVLKKVRKVKMLKENNQRMRYLTPEECQSLIGACEDHLKPIVITALNTGMRRGEIMNLVWEDIDLRNGFIFVRNTKNGERRDIPINQQLRTTLEELYRGSKDRPRKIHIPYVFYYHVTSNPIISVKRSFSTALRKVGIKDFRFHDLRHTFASQLVMAGADLAAVRELLGHKTLTMTLRYSHLAPNHKVQTVNLLDKALKDGSSSQLLHNML